MSTEALRRITVEEYFALDEASPRRLDFIDGQVIDPQAMAGGSFDHSTLGTNVGYALRPAIEARNCRPFSGDQRVRIGADGDYCYPDFTVVCGEVEGEGTVLDNPTLVVEVLSPGTQGYDRGEKFERYLRLPSVEEIVFVAQDRPRVERYRRHGDVWLYEVVDGMEAQIVVLGEPLRLAEVYRHIVFKKR